MPFQHGFEMKNPIAVFSSIAAVAVAAIGTTVYVNRTPVEPLAMTAPADPAKAPEVVAKVEAPAAPAVETPAVETPVQQQAAVAPAPVVEAPAPAPAVENTTEVAVVPAPAEPAVVAAPAQPAPAPVVAEAAPSLPSFDTVRVETTGDAIIAGRAAPDSDVTVKWNGNIVGTTKANSDGSFVLIPAHALKTGIGAMTIEMASKGVITTSEGSVFVVVKKDAPAMIAKVDPVAPTQVVQSGTPAVAPKDLQLTAVDYDQTGNIVFTGTATAGSTVRFYVDNAATGEGKSDDKGKWSFAGTSAVTPGTHVLRADAVDAAGQVVSRIELPFLRESAETVAAAQVAVAEPVVPAPVNRSVAVVKPAAPVAPDVPPAPETPALETQVAVTPTPAIVPVVEEGPKKLVIQPGNNLWKLSRQVYGKGRMFTIIYEANRDQLRNPNKIFPGQILTAPKQN
jgi:nucleoid-associated protein YgaU